MSHTASKTWISDEAREYETWSKIRDGMARLSPASPFTPKTFAEWITHQLARKEEDCRHTVERLANKEAQKKALVAPVDPIFRGKELGDHLAPVLARESIWTPSPDPPPGRLSAPWPTHEEFKHEGDDRSRSGYSRFPPLPRDPGNETVNWKQRRPVVQCPFDQIGQPTLAADTSNGKQPEQEALQYIDHSLLKLLDS